VWCRTLLWYPATPIVEVDIKFLLGVLNSKAFGWLVRTQAHHSAVGNVKFSKQYIETAPIPPADAGWGNRNGKLWTSMLDLKRPGGRGEDAPGTTVLTRRIETTGMRIDRLVCGLYGLTDDEIRLVEEELQG